MSRARGAAGEELAAAFLESKGYVIVERNFSCRFGEIDIVAREGGQIVFAEVKLRASDSFAPAAQAVNPAKMRRLHSAALVWFSIHGEQSARFDVVEIYDGDRPRIHLIKNAF